MFFFTLAACHLFSPEPTIDCVRGMPCAKPGDSGSGDSGDTVTPGPAAELGFAVSLSGGASSRIRRYDPQGVKLNEWTGFTDGGQTAWDDTLREGIFVSPSGVWLLAGDGTNSKKSGAAGTLNDVAWFNGKILYSASSDLGAVDPATFDVTTIESDASEYTSLVVQGDLARALRLQTSPDVFNINTSFEGKLAQADYDSSTALSTALALGPGAANYVCSSAGAVYATADLDDGDTGSVPAPSVVYPGALNDLSACAYDPGDESWLFGSPTLGVVRLSSAGVATTLYSPEAAYDIADIAFAPSS